MHQTQTVAEIQKLNIPTTLPPTEASTCFKVPSAPVRAAKNVSKSKIPTLNKNGFQSKLPIMTSAGKENNFLNVKESKNSTSELKSPNINLHFWKNSGSISQIFKLFSIL